MAVFGVISRILTEYGEIRSLSPYSVWMRENTDQNNSEYDHFSRSAILRIFDIIEYHLMLNPQLNLKSFKNIYQNKDSPEKIECIWSKLFSFLNQSWRESFIKWPLHISSEWIITSVIIWGSDFGVTLYALTELFGSEYNFYLFDLERGTLFSELENDYRFLRMHEVIRIQRIWTILSLHFYIKVINHIPI